MQLRFRNRIRLNNTVQDANLQVCPRLLNSRQLELQEFQQLQRNRNIQATSESHLQSSSRQDLMFSTNLSCKADHVRALSNEISHITAALPKSIHPLGFEKKVEKTFEHIFDRLESETKRSSLPGIKTEAESTSESRNPQPRDWIRYTIEERFDVLRSFLGTIYVRSRISKLQSRYFENRYQYEHETSFTVRPAWWLVKVGLTYIPRSILFQSTIKGWKHTLDSFRLVSDDALIFEFCSTGNLSDVQALLARGKASVKDINSRGRTALHVT